MFRNKSIAFFPLILSLAFTGCKKEEQNTSCPIQKINISGNIINPYSLDYSYDGNNLAMIKKTETEYSTFYYNQNGQLSARKRYINGILVNTDSIFYNPDGRLDKWNLYDSYLMVVDRLQFNYMNGRLEQVIQNLYPNFYPIIANYEYTGNDITSATIQYGGQDYATMKYTPGQETNPLKELIPRSHGFSTIPSISPEHVPFLFNEKAVLVIKRDTSTSFYSYLFEKERLKKLDITYPDGSKKELGFIYTCE
jgi:hypothetical protein